jgi:hypothetical protein
MAMGTMEKPGMSSVDHPGFKGKKSISGSPLFVGISLMLKIVTVIAVIVAAIFAFILLLGYVDTNTPVVNVTIPVQNMTGAAVVLANQKNATDPTYDQLVQFLAGDKTSERKYKSPDFTCADFARTLHDSAEAHDIRAGFASIEFFEAGLSYAEYDDGSGSFSPPTRTQDVGHGFNVFNTTDRGLVYVDVTANTGSSTGENGVRIAYVEEGRELGEIRLDRATSTSYSFFEAHKLRYLDYIRDLRAYNQKVAAYNEEVKAFGDAIPADRRYEFSIRADQLKNTGLELDDRKEEMGPFYYPQGIVKKVTVYW